MSDEAENGGLLDSILKRFSGLKGVKVNDVTGYLGTWPGGGVVVDNNPQILSQAVQREKRLKTGHEILRTAASGQDKVKLD